MLSDNIKLLRKQRGYSQEVLADKLHVVRQTVSKWEKGLSVPDADLLARLAEVLEVSVTELLGGHIPAPGGEKEDAVAAQLAQINEQLVIRNRRSRRVFRVVFGFICGILVLYLILVVLGMISFRAMPRSSEGEETISEVILEGEDAEPEPQD